MNIEERLTQLEKQLADQIKINEELNTKFMNERRSVQDCLETMYAYIGNTTRELEVTFLGVIEKRDAALKPKYTVRYEMGCKIEEWLVDGHLDRADGPARIYYYANGAIRCAEWHQKGMLHRTDGPAVIRYYQEGQIEYESWWQNGKGHRTNGPAVIAYFENGAIRCEEWYQNGKHHRTDGPAVIDYRENGKVQFEDWVQNGKYCRKDGAPHSIAYDESGKIIWESRF